MKDKSGFRQNYQNKFDALKKVVIEKPAQGWIRTIRRCFGMTTVQFAQKIQVKQPRVVFMEKNENNMKISTMERIADFLNCDFFYAFIPRENLDDILYNQARAKAQKILSKINQNTATNNQPADTEKLLEDLTQELLDGSIARLWDDE